MSFEVSADLCDRIITDEEWLWQMILNLLTNACKYTDRGEIRVVLSLQHGPTGTCEDDMLLIEVIDTGTSCLYSCGQCCIYVEPFSLF